MTLPSRSGCVFLSLIAFTFATLLAGCGGSSFSAQHVTPPVSGAPKTLTPIQHVIIVVGENHSFDNVFATYQPADPSQQVWNLLSQGIVDVNGNPGPNYALAQQSQAMDIDYYRINPPQTGPYATLPRPSTAVNPLLTSFVEQFAPIVSDPGLAPSDQGLMNLGGVFNLHCLTPPPCTQPPPPCIQIPFAPDTRFPANLPSGPFQITNCANYNDTVGDPMHRFYQMWQQN